MGCMCIPLLFSLSFYSILVGKYVFNIVNQRLCFHATTTTGNSALTNNKKRLSDFNWKGVQDKCSLQCSTTGMWRCGSWAAVAIGKSCSCVENTNQSQGMKQLGWLLRPVGSMAVLHGDMEMPASHCWRMLPCQNYKLGALYSKVNDVSSAQNHLYLCCPLGKKVEKKRKYCFTICRCNIYLVFPESIHFSLLDVFSPISRSVLYQKIWINGDNRCLGTLVHICLFVLDQSASVWCVAHRSWTPEAEKFSSQRTESLCSMLQTGPQFCSHFPCVQSWLIVEAWRGIEGLYQATWPQAICWWLLQ